MVLKLRCKHLQGLEGCEITWYSNTCYTSSQNTLEAEEIAEFSNKNVGGFAL